MIKPFAAAIVQISTHHQIQTIIGLNREQNQTQFADKQPAVAASEDAQLLALLREPKTQEAGFRLLLRLYQERLYWHLRSLLHEHNAADEALQNTLIKIFRSIQQFRGDAQLYTWIYRIATNEALSYLRQRGRYLQRFQFEETMPESSENAQEINIGIDGEKAQALLQQAIAALPDKQKIVFSLRYFQEMPYSEMSTLLDTSQGALKASYHHAAKKVEQFIRERI